MKKLVIAIQIIALGIFTTTAWALNMEDWYTYNGSSKTHTFSVSFPKDYKVITEGDEVQVIKDKEKKEVLRIKEFEGKTYQQAISSYIDDGAQVESQEDMVFSSNDDLIAKKVKYSDQEITFIKRGSLIISITEPKTDMAQAVYDSFKFTDGWHQYIDYGGGYTFIFPNSLKINTISNGVEIKNEGQYQGEIFRVLKYSETELDDAAELAEGSNESLEGQKDILFHGMKARLATYVDNKVGKKLSRVIIGKNGDSYSLTSTNITNNFPHFNYYDDYLLEMLESFEFFDIEGEYYTYSSFPDVRDNHPNSEAINSLSESKIINGYPDGKFRPDGLINRAELTKMIVASQVDPNKDKYKNCFPDVTDQWFAPYICYAKEQQWVGGYENGTFQPEKNINRVEAMKIIFEALFEKMPEPSLTKKELAKDVSTSEWYYKYFDFANTKKLLDKSHVSTNEDGTYSYYPNENISRKEVAETLFRSLQIN